MIRLSDLQGRILQDILRSIPVMSGTDELLQLVTEQLSTPRHTEDLVDTIAKFLMDPRTDSISRGNLMSLRKIILSPSELSKYTSQANKNGECGGCGRRFHDAEMVSAHGKAMMCFTCYRPEVVHCNSCDDLIEVSGTWRTVERAKAKHTCTGRRDEPIGPPDQTLSVEIAPLRREQLAPGRSANIRTMAAEEMVRPASQTPQEPSNRTSWIAYAEQRMPAAPPTPIYSLAEEDRRMEALANSFYLNNGDADGPSE